MESMISFDDLPKDILRKIPLSLRTAKTTHRFEELPPEIQYLLSNYDLTTADEIDHSAALELQPDISIYNDFKTLTDVKEIVIEYLKNHLRVLTGSYPYDVSVGSGLKFHLQTKDTTLRNTLIFNELSLIIDSMSNHYSIPIKIVERKFDKVEYEDRTEVQISLIIEVDGDQFAISIN